MPDADGPELLKSFLAASELGINEFARKAGISHSIVSRALSGKRRPGADAAAAIEDATNKAVPARSWGRSRKSSNPKQRKAGRDAAA